MFILDWPFKWLEPTLQNVKLWRGNAQHVAGKAKKRGRYAMTLFEEYILTLVRIRRGYDTVLLAYLFGISQSHVSRLFTTWVNVLYRCFLPLLRWPSAQLVRQNLPPSFKQFPKTRVIIDATEFHVEKPFRPVAQKTTW